MEWRYSGESYGGVPFNACFVRHVNEEQMDQLGTAPKPRRGLFAIGQVIEGTDEVQAIRVGHGLLQDELTPLLQSMPEKYPGMTLIATHTFALAEGNLEAAVACLINRLMPTDQPQGQPDVSFPCNGPSHWRSGPVS